MVNQKLFSGIQHHKNLRSSIATARNFFKKHNELVLYQHGKRVLDLALNKKVIDKRIINNKLSVEDSVRDFNNTLTQILLYHTLEPQNISVNDKTLPDIIKYSSHLYKELEKFSVLTHLIRNGANPSELVDVINHTFPPPLALVAVLVDAAQTHMDESKTFLFIKKNHNPMFRFYSSKDEIEVITRNSAKFSEIFLAQISELFGYQSIAGEIFLQAYSINHPYIFQLVNDFNENNETTKRAFATLSVVRSIKKALKAVLKSMNFDCEIQLRERKNIGKQMKKLAYRLRYKYPGIIADGEIDSEKQIEEQKKITSNFSLFNFFNDLVALRIIIDRFGGKPLESLGEKSSQEAATAVKDLARQIILTLGLTFSKQKIEEKFYDTPRGYRSWHINVDPCDNCFLKYEIQIRTREWHNIAEFGEAAHYLYNFNFNNQHLMDNLRSSYQELLASLRNHK